MIENRGQVSITHVHLGRIIEAHACRGARICDAGCGNGELIKSLLRTAQTQSEGAEFYGFDVGDGGVQDSGFLAEAISGLRRDAPGVDWENRIHMIESADAWPFVDDFFDIVISNQVLEHVQDHRHFFSELYRTMRTGGVSAHLFPLKECIWESHLDLPLAHRIRRRDWLVSYIKFLSFIGIGKYRRNRVSRGYELDAYSESHADYIIQSTNYLMASEVLRYAKDAGFMASLRFTQEFYATKLRSVFRMRAVPYSLKRNALLDKVLSSVLKRVSSVTLFLHKM